ncbi:MAG: amino acid carrier protein, partial [Bacteroidaceae bacterium]|nr:amino acid carrier protein [Bacteroidaceae bacterium]
METINTINDWIWTFIIIPLLGGCAVWFTFRTRGVQFRMLGHMIKLIMESPSSAGGSDGTAEKGQKHISSFHAFVISLASRIGTGNLAGVASAIFVGGPGAVFWMWVMALLGAATAFVESSLAQLYKRKVPGAFIGGPAYYMQYGLHCRWLGIVFSVLLMLSFGMSNQMMQSNQICTSLNDTFGFPIEWLTGVMAVFTGIIIFGGVHRIANFSSAVVPVMAIAYLLLAVVIIVMNITEVPHVLKLIITNAFGLEQAAGGAIGTVISQGVKRGLFSNEAGEGS